MHGTRRPPGSARRPQLLARAVARSVPGRYPAKLGSIRGPQPQTLPRPGRRTCLSARVPGASALTAELRPLLLSTHLPLPEIAEEMFLPARRLSRRRIPIYPH